MSNLNDFERLAALAATGLLDSAPEADFDRVTRLIRATLHVDVALISLVDGSRQFFKSSSGLHERVGPITETPLTHSFCQHVVLSEQTLAVEDARVDELVKNNLAVRDLNVIAYLGCPLRSPEGHVIGSVCAIGGQPRQWTMQDRQSLADFAALVEDAVARRAEMDKAKRLAESNEVLASEFIHRAKNLLAVVQSLLSLSARDTATSKDLAEVLRGRLDAYALAQDAVTGQGGEHDLDLLMRRLLRPYAHDGKELVVSGPSVPLAQKQITPICLIIHELATNSAKYGALQRMDAPAVTWTLAGDRVTITWLERTKKADEPGPGGGFGNQLFNAAARQLKGTISRSWDGDLMSVTFSFDCTRVTPAL